MRLFSNASTTAGLLAVLILCGSSAYAQSQGTRRYFPLDHRIPGRASHWAQTIDPPCEAYVQPVRIELPSRGLITFFDAAPEAKILTQAPSQAGMLVGQTYRFRISGMPEFPGVELYPSIELIDRLHPPAGQEQEFPIPVQLTEEEIAAAIDDQLVTKVVYLEQPQLADPQPVDRPLRVTDLPNTTNLLQAADQRGRTMAIIRIGGRVPSLQDPTDRHFFNNAAPVLSPTAMSHRESKSGDVAVDNRVQYGPLAAE